VSGRQKTCGAAELLPPAEYGRGTARLLNLLSVGSPGLKGKPSRHGGVPPSCLRLFNRWYLPAVRGVGARAQGVMGGDCEVLWSLSTHVAGGGLLKGFRG